MTLINTNKVNFKNFKKESYNEKFIIFLFSFLPISLILGNSAINSNILIVDLFFLLTCYRQKQWSWIRNKYFYFFISIWIYLVINSIISENVVGSLYDAHLKEIINKQKNIPGSIFFTILFLVNLNKKPEIKNEKPSINPPTTNSSLKKLTILFEDGLSKPNKLKLKIRSKTTSIKTTKIIMDQYKNI